MTQWVSVSKICNRCRVFIYLQIHYFHDIILEHLFGAWLVEFLLNWHLCFQREFYWNSRSRQGKMKEEFIKKYHEATALYDKNVRLKTFEYFQVLFR